MIIVVKCRVQKTSATERTAVITQRAVLFSENCPISEERSKGIIKKKFSRTQKLSVAIKKQTRSQNSFNPCLMTFSIREYKEKIN